jgi:hypothetical protein
MTSLPQYAFMAWYLVKKAQGQFFFTDKDSQKILLIEQFLYSKSKQRNQCHIQEQRIILKWIFKVQGVRIWPRLMWLRTDQW